MTTTSRLGSFGGFAARRTLSDAEKLAQRERRKTGNAIEFGKDPKETRQAEKHRSWKMSQEYHDKRKKLLEVIHLNPERYDLYNDLAALHLAQPVKESREPALGYWDRSVTLNPDQLNVWIAIAKWHWNNLLGPRRD